MVCLFQKTQEEKRKAKTMKKQNKKRKKLKLIWITSIIILIATLFTIFSILLYPFQNMHTASRIIEFKFTGLATNVLIDDNPDFTSPIVKTKPFILDLEPGTYYWKTNFLSPVRIFTIDSEVTINLLKKENQTYTIQNKGNTIIDLIVRNIRDWAMTGKAIVGVNEELDIEVKNDSAIEASQSKRITGKFTVIEAEKTKEESWLKKNFILILVMMLLILTFIHILLNTLKQKRKIKNEIFK